MPLSLNMNAEEIVDYLRDDLRISVINDIGPCINGQGGYFAVPKLVLSYVDYLGALFRGYTAWRIKRRRIFANHTYAKRFLNYIFGVIDPNYSLYGNLLWEIYRNGTIHLYEPMKLTNSNQTIYWLTYKGPRATQLPYPYLFYANHLVPHNYGNCFWAQPISINCIYNDLMSAIDRFASLIPQYRCLESKFRQVADALQTPEETNVRWW
jgi:hypothetical protein